MPRMKTMIAAALALVLGGLLPPPASALSADIESKLAASEYVYISSTRKDGSLGKPAEIWFLFHEGAVYVGTRTSSWRVKRIQWGRPEAKISVGKLDGPSFSASGELIDDDELEALMMKTYASKYPEGWKKYEETFRKGFAGGTHVVVKYLPKAD